jgi:catechol 2,3-dioxygenase-like lactoylglutathione lyase family enzyme
MDGCMLCLRALRVSNALTVAYGWAMLPRQVIDGGRCDGEVGTVARVQLALNVSDVDAAVDFYTKLFGVSPAKRRPGYANFAIDVPPLKLVLIENPDARGAGVVGALNHLGVEVETSDEVAAAAGRLAGAGLATATEENTACCYAVQDKVWVDDPDGAPWEVYTVLSDITEPVGPALRMAESDGPGSACACGPAADCGPGQAAGATDADGDGAELAGAGAGVASTAAVAATAGTR